MHDDVVKVIEHRIEERIPWDALISFAIPEVYIAGNSLNRANPNDIDLFPVNSDDFSFLADDKRIICKTPNASTYKLDNTIVQFCNFRHTTLALLVQSFDFAHVQIGAKINIQEHVISEVYYTDAWTTAHCTGSTFYTGGEFPLSSLIRINKYIKREEFSGKSYIPSVINILSSIVRRGFANYADFKNQLDAVDLGLVESDMRDCNLMGLFELLRRDK
jgi:hypothetical protein